MKFHVHACYFVFASLALLARATSEFEPSKLMSVSLGAKSGGDSDVRTTASTERLTSTTEIAPVYKPEVTKEERLTPKKNEKEEEKDGEEYETFQDRQMGGLRRRKRLIRKMSTPPRPRYPVPSRSRGSSRSSSSRSSSSSIRSSSSNRSGSNGVSSKRGIKKRVGAPYIFNGIEPQVLIANPSPPVITAYDQHKAQTYHQNALTNSYSTVNNGDQNTSPVLSFNINEGQSGFNPTKAKLIQKALEQYDLLLDQSAQGSASPDVYFSYDPKDYPDIADNLMSASTDSDSETDDTSVSNSLNPESVEAKRRVLFGSGADDLTIGRMVDNPRHLFAGSSGSDYHNVIEDKKGEMSNLIRPDPVFREIPVPSPVVSQQQQQQQNVDSLFGTIYPDTSAAMSQISPDPVFRDLGMRNPVFVDGAHPSKYNPQ